MNSAMDTCTLSSIIESPRKWAALFGKTYGLGQSHLEALLTQLEQLPGPIARARECQILIGLNKIDRALSVVLDLSHPLCRAMALFATLVQKTPEACLYITEQSATLSGANLFTPLGQEAQMRWDFSRAQAFHELGDTQSALQFYAVASRFAEFLGTDTIARVCQAQTEVLSSKVPSSKILALSRQLERAIEEGDTRTADQARTLLCEQHAYIEDYPAFLTTAQSISHHESKMALVTGAQLLLGLPPECPPPIEEGLENHPFAMMAHLLHKLKRFKDHLRLHRDRRVVETIARGILAPTVPSDLNYPAAGIMAACFQAMTFTLLREYSVSRNILKRLQTQVSSQTDLPRLAQYTVDLARADLLHRSDPQSPELEPLLDAIKGHLEQSTIVQTLALDLCPELVYLIYHRWGTYTAEQLLNKILLVTETGIFLGGNELDGFPRQGLREAMALWTEGDPMDTNHYQILSRYARSLRRVRHSGVVVTWTLPPHLRPAPVAQPSRPKSMV